MYKHSPSRNQRSKGFKVKQVLQICVLVAVCFWLIYQVQHSHNKKKAFEENDANTTLETNSHRLNFAGRKGLHDPLEKKPFITKTKDEEETEHENGVEDDDSKHEEEEQEQEQEEDNTKEEIDEHDQEKSEMEIEHEVDILDEERDREEVNEDEENENDDKETQNKDVSQVKDHDHEAREEQYKGDDASSAVTHEAESVSAKTEKGNPEKSVEKMESNGLEKGRNVVNNTEDTMVDKNATDVDEKRGEIIENLLLLNVTMKEKERSENVLSKQDETLISNSTTMTKSITNQEETGNDLARKSIETNDIPLMTSTEAKQDAIEGKISTNPSLNNTRLDSNLMDTQNLKTVQGEPSNSSTTSKAFVSEKEKTDVSTKRNRNENLELKKETVESETEEGGVDHHDPIDDSDTSVSLEKDAKTDLDTFSHMKTERSSDEKDAAE